MILNPNFPNLFDKILDILKIKKVINKTRTKATINDTMRLLFVDSDDKIIIEAIDPGPAIKGIPSGVYAISLFSSASFSSFGVVFVLDLFVLIKWVIQLYLASKLRSSINGRGKI